MRWRQLDDMKLGTARIPSGRADVGRRDVHARAPSQCCLRRPAPPANFNTFTPSHVHAGEGLIRAPTHDSHYKSRMASPTIVISVHGGRAFGGVYVSESLCCERVRTVIVCVCRGDHATESYHRCASRDQIT